MTEPEIARLTGGHEAQHRAAQAFWCNAPPKRVSLCPGHVVTVARLDRARPSTRDLLNILAAITCPEAGFRSLGDAWADTTTAHGRTACYRAAIRARGCSALL